MNEELIPLNLLIADRTYRVKVNPSDEAVVRHTAKVINDKLVEYKTQFAGKDMQDYLAMVLIWFATDQHASITRQVNMEDVAARLQAMEKILTAALQDESGSR